MYFTISIGYLVAVVVLGWSGLEAYAIASLVVANVWLAAHLSKHINKTQKPLTVADMKGERTQ